MADNIVSVVAAGLEERESESSLFDHFESVKHACSRSSAIMIKLVKLRARHRRPDQIRTAFRILDRLLYIRDIQVSALTNLGLPIIYKSGSQNSAETSVLKEQFLLGDDPLFDVDSSETLSQSHEIRTNSDLESSYAVIQRQVRGMVHVDQDTVSGTTAEEEAKAEMFVCNFTKERGYRIQVDLMLLRRQCGGVIRQEIGV